MIHIREASTKDISIIRYIAEETWWPTYSPILEKSQNEFMLSEIYSEVALERAFHSGDQTFLILEEESTPRAFASYGIWKEDDSALKINKLYVLPGHHGKGFGKILIDEIFNRAKENQKKAIVLNVNRHNPALSFYQKIGFQIFREEDIPIGPYWMNDYLMRMEF